MTVVGAGARVLRLLRRGVPRDPRPQGPVVLGHGGHEPVEAALQRLDKEEGCTHFLFETAIPAFYQRLGAKLLEKELVINSTGDRIAFEDEFVMVYPAARHWPEGEIDLLGPGY